MQQFKASLLEVTAKFIATRIGATDHMIEDGVDGFLVPQRESDAIRDRLTELAEDAERLAALKQAAKGSASRLDVRLTAQRILDLFRGGHAAAECLSPREPLRLPLNQCLQLINIIYITRPIFAGTQP
jgi:hypothetical protein